MAVPRLRDGRRGLHFAFVAATLAIGCSSQPGKPAGGSGGMSGAAGAACTDPLMIDDMEDGDGFICGSSGRLGDWYTISDGTSANLSPATSDPFTQTLIPGGRGSSRYAARMTGSGFQQGAAMGFHLNGQGTAVRPYDASTKQGVRFWMKSNAPVSVFFPLPETVRTGQAGGTCVDAATEANCDNHFRFPIVTAKINEWVEYDVPYSAGYQYGSIDANGNVIRGSVTWNPSRVLGVEFGVSGLRSFDVWIDDVRFYSCEPTACVPTCTDPTAPVACPAGIGFPASCWSAGTDCSAALGLTLVGVWSSGPNDVWAVGSANRYGATVHWDGSTWSVVPSGSPPLLLGVWGSGPNDVWAIGDRGTILHWDGSAWSIVSSGALQRLAGLWGSGPSDVWAVGALGTILHWDGSIWSAVPSGVSVYLSGVWGSGPNDVWAVGGENNGGTILHWNGSSWSLVRGAAGPLVDVWGSGPNDVWAVGVNNRSISVHWNGSVWSVVPSGASPLLTGVWGNGPNDVWAVGNDGTLETLVGTVVGGAIFHWDGTAWSAAPNESAPLNNVWGSDPSNVWAVGYAGTIVHWDGSAWSTVPTGGLR